MLSSKLLRLRSDSPRDLRRTLGETAGSDILVDAVTEMILDVVEWPWPCKRPLQCKTYEYSGNQEVLQMDGWVVGVVMDPRLTCLLPSDFYVNNHRGKSAHVASHVVTMSNMPSTAPASISSAASVNMATVRPQGMVDPMHAYRAKRDRERRT